MNKENIIRKAEKEDAKRVWEIRNHPLARKNSGSTEVIPLENHILWFEKKYFSDQDNHCFILENEDKEEIGYCRFDFDHENDNHIVSIAIDPENHGKGMGHELLDKTLKIFKTEKVILAEIKKDNIPSVKLFEKNGFEIYREDDENYYYKYIP